MAYDARIAGRVPLGCRHDEHALEDPILNGPAKRVDDVRDERPAFEESAQLGATEAAA
jgi:hypothetical protein